VRKRCHVADCGTRLGILVTLTFVTVRVRRDRLSLLQFVTVTKYGEVEELLVRRDW
jgi:hypothetical protein